MAVAADVIGGAARWSVEAADAVAFLRGLPDGCCSLVLFSPPYSDARAYGIGFRLRGQAWVDWLRPVVVEACRVSAGLVAVNATAPVKGHRYAPAVEWLVADLTRLDGLCCGPSPYAWVRNGIPGSGNKHYHRRNWEPVYCFARPDRLPLAWSDNTAFGRPPKYGPGGECSHRLTDGTRANQWGQSPGGGRCRRPAGSRQPSERPSHRFGTKATARGYSGGDLATGGYAPPSVANPGNVIRTGNGGNQMGHPLAHENEAPMNLAVAERLVGWFAPPGSVVCDPFSGSGTTAHAAVLHGRRFVGCDLRESQAELTRRRVATVTPSVFTTGG